MLISFGNNGQFGNACLASAHLAAHSIEHGYRIHILNLAAHAWFFARDGVVPSVRIGSARMVQRLGVNTAAFLSRLGTGNHCSFGPVSWVRDAGISTEDTAMKAGRGLVFQTGWGLQDRSLLRKHAPVVRSILMPAAAYRERATARFQSLTGEFGHVIGVHVRQKDYKHYREGIYYFSQSVYQDLAAQAVRMAPTPPSQTRILVFSDEALDWPDELAGARVHQAGGSWWEDFLCMTMCDLIIGPPSTFSGSASLLGDVPWFQIKDKEAPFDKALALPYLESGIRV